MWPSNGHVVKVGGRGRDDVPESWSELRGALSVDAAGRRARGPAAGGAGRGAGQAKDEAAYDPNNPQPDLDKYDPKKTKLPTRDRSEDE